MVEREKIKLILTRIPGIENSRYALVRAQKVDTNQVHFKSSEQFVALFCKLNIERKRLKKLMQKIIVY